MFACAAFCLKQDLKRFLANPGNRIRSELVEGKWRAKLLISAMDNTSVFPSCQDEPVSLCSFQSLQMYTTAVLGFKVTGNSLGEEATSDSAYNLSWDMRSFLFFNQPKPYIAWSAPWLWVLNALHAGSQLVSAVEEKLQCSGAFCVPVGVL